MSISIDLDGKVALVTGASRGIGREIARRLGESGASVGVNYLHSEEEAQSLVGAIGSERALALQGDVGVPAEVEKIIHELTERFGRIDVLVNNAAIFELNPFDGDDYDRWIDGWRKTFEVNVFGAANASFLAIRVMRRQRSGKIINIASRAASRGELEFADYGASKAALMNLTRSIARGCAQWGITSNCINPGFIETDMAAGEIERRGDEIRGEVPLGRIGAPRDVADLVVFLASPMADYLNGATIDVNGGSWFS
ncbi:MAG: SDR family oxidoreductase [Thermoanaerobaculia bacterium]|nr:SDR family oxidoreductase [Thermoanaerobaculia bacterium]